LNTKPIAVVTGASSAIGFELAREFAAHEFDLLITTHKGSTAEARGACEALGARVKEVSTDLATYEGVEALAQQIAAFGRPIDVIALNAGLGGDLAPPTALRDELRLIDVHVTSTVHLAKRLLPAMVERGQGRVFFNASIASVLPGPFQAVYAASQAFVHSFAEALRSELKGTGVTVTSLLQEPTDSSFFGRANMDDIQADASNLDDPARVAKYSFAALMAGKDHVDAGSMINKAETTVSQALPDAFLSQGDRKLALPGSGSAKYI
jgi:uncharacterized protein